MDIIYWLIPLSICILIIAVLIFFWAVKDGQFNDLDAPAINILLDDDVPKPVNLSKTVQVTPAENDQATGKQ